MRILSCLAVLAVLAMFTGVAMADPGSWSREWPDTSFDKSSITDWREILSGGPPKDGIPALIEPTFTTVAEKRGIKGSEPVIAVEIGQATPRAYPIRYLIWHEIVNDDVGGIPVAVTFCPLCNSAMTFDRRTSKGTLTFGVSGKLRNSDMIMYDRETQSWWQQAIGEAIVWVI